MATMSWRDWHESSRERMWEKSKASYGVTGAVFTGGSSSFYHSRNIFGEINCWCYSKRFKHFHLASMLQSRIQFISALASPLLNFAVPILCRVLFAIMSLINMGYWSRNSNLLAAWGLKISVWTQPFPKEKERQHWDHVPVWEVRKQH